MIRLQSLGFGCSAFLYVNAMVGTCWTEAAATLVPKLASADGEVRRKRVDDNRRIYSDRESSMKLRR
jgi:hypothetical protein